MKEEILYEYITDCFRKKQPLEQKMHSKAMHLFKEYMLVGGMPQAVLAFAKNGRDFLYEHVLMGEGDWRCVFLMNADGSPKCVEGHEGYDLSISAVLL